jgi:4-amino-4-deoxy-L-arabinose transferase-like glycosyltransferase
MTQLQETRRLEAAGTGALERRYVRVALGLLALGTTLAAGAFLRLYEIDKLGFNSDEAVYTGQAASIANVSELEEFFPIFRAHPLLFQSILSLGFHLDLGGPFERILSAAVGLATVCVVYLLGSLLYGRRAGLIAALLMALMPYHVVVTRQVLLDAPMTLFATLTLYLMARFALTQRAGWLYAAAAALGFTFLSKETGLVLIAAIYAFFVLSPEIRVRTKQLLVSAGILAVVMVQFPLALLIAGRTGTGGNYLAWQLFRRANHDLFFYPIEIPLAIGPLLIIAAVLGLWLLHDRRSWRETLLLTWILVPLLFFELYPVKGFQYLLLIAPPLAVLAARFAAQWSPEPGPGRLRSRLSRGWFGPLAVGVLAITLAVPSWLRVQASTSTTLLAGSGGVPGGREAGQWIDENVPEGSRLMTIGPSMANILQYYGHRKAYALSVSTNPLNRNPSYEPIRNPDFRIRNNEFQYLVWDSFSADRSSFFSEGLLRYADRFNGRVVHTQSATVETDDGHSVRKPMIVVYQVRP